MRCLGQINGRSSAESFVAYLLTQDISTQIEALDEDSAAENLGVGNTEPPSRKQPSDRWELWVRDEDKLAQAQLELKLFQANPRDAKYASALTTAKSILVEKEKKRQQIARNIKRVDMRRTPGVAGGPMPPLTLTLLILSVLISLISSFGRPTNEWGASIVQKLSFVSPIDYMTTNQDPAASIKRGELWRLVTPIFLHLSMIHLAMNMLVLISFGRIVERLVGTPKFALFVLLLAVGPNLLQGLSPAWMDGSPHFGGISGVLYGLFGYVWIRGTLNPQLGISVPFPMVVILVGMIVVGLSGAVPNWPYAELCHLGGLLIGCAIGFASEQDRK